MERFEALFGRKPVIAMVHLKALPGTPLYDGDLEAIVEAARKDLLALQEAGVEAVMFGNENDRPYELSVDRASVAAMAYVIGQLKPLLRVLRVDVLWDPLATMALAAATGARFAREIFTGLYGSDMGLWEGRAAEALRYRKRLLRDDLFLLYNVSAEFASPWTGGPFPSGQKAPSSPAWRTRLGLGSHDGGGGGPGAPPGGEGSPTPGPRPRQHRGAPRDGGRDPGGGGRGHRGHGPQTGRGHLERGGP